LLEEYSDVLRSELPPGLPISRAANHRIILQPGHTPPAQRPYRTSPQEDAEMRRQIQAQLDAGVIQPSTSPYASPVIFVKKKDGSLLYYYKL